MPTTTPRRTERPTRAFVMAALALSSIVTGMLGATPPARAAGTLAVSWSPTNPTSSDSITITATITGCGIANVSIPSLYYYVTGPGGTRNNYYSTSLLSGGGDIASASVTFAAGHFSAGSYNAQVYGRGIPCFASSFDFTWTSISVMTVTQGASVPSAPTSLSATAGDGEATVTWAAATDNGSAITGYTITASPGGQTCSWTTGPLTCTVSGLTNGTAYTFSATATNVVGIGSLSSASSAVTPAGLPGAPTQVTATRSDGGADVTWAAPSANGSAITGYTITASPGGQTCSWTTGPLACTMTGLTNGTAYTFTAAATNGVGTGSASQASSAVTPAGLPGAPGGLEAEAGDGEATLTWTAAAANGAPITGYTITSDPGDLECTWTSGPLTCTVTGLDNGTAYTFTARGLNDVGAGALSDATGSVIPAGLPAAPSQVEATPGDGQATISWAEAAANGSAITSYMVTATPGGQTCAWTSGALSCTVTGLDNGTAYTFVVAATNAIGSGAASLASDAVVPVAPDLDVDEGDDDQGSGNGSSPSTLKISLSVSADAMLHGSRVRVHGLGMFPGSTVRIELHSDPILLGTALVGSGGTFSKWVTIPSSAPAGTHTIVVTGTDANGDEVTARRSIVLSAATGGGGAFLASTGASAGSFGWSGLTLLLLGAALARAGRRATPAP